MTFMKRKAMAALAGAAIVALGLAGCSGSPSTNSTSSPDGETTQLVSTAWERASRDDIAEGGKITLAIDSAPANWNLNNADAGTVDSQTLSNLFTARYVLGTEDGSWEANPDYAESVELISESPQVVQIKINPKAVWSDGTPMSVKDFVSTWTSLNGKDPAYAPNATNVWEDIDKIEAGDNDQDVRITFGKVNADWPSIFSNIWPAWLGATPESFNTLWQKMPVAADGKTTVSGGPFIVSDFDATGGVVTFTPNDKWWGDKPKLESVLFKVVARAQLAQSFANKELTAFSIGTNADNYTTAQAREDATIQQSLGTLYSHVTLNGTTEIFKDVEVRQAFAKSLNRELMAQARLKPIGAPVGVLNNLIFLPGQDGYTDDGEGVISYDIEAAKKQLEDAGWTEGDGGIREKDGQKLSIRYVIDSDNPVSQAGAEMVQASAKESGFDVKIDVVPSDDFFTKYVTTEERDFDAVGFSWQGTAFPISSTQSLYYPADSGQNYPGVTDESLGKMWEEANAELDPAKRIEQAQAIDKKIVALATTIPTFAIPFTYGVQNGLVNYGPAQFEDIKWQDIGFKK